MQKDIEALNDLVLKIKRLETTLSSKIDRFVESEKAIADYKKELTMEIEELKSLRQSLPDLIAASMESSSKKELPKILPSLVKTFQEATIDFAQSSVKEAQRLNNEVNRMILEAKQAISSGKKDMTLRRIRVNLFICLSSILTAIAIFYLYPQHVYYDFNADAGKYISYGIAYEESFKELCQKDKDLIMDKAVKRFMKRDF